MSGRQVGNEASALAVRLLFLLEAQRLDLLPHGLGDAVARFAAAVEVSERRAVDLASAVLCQFAECAGAMGLADLSWPQPPHAEEGAVRAVAARLGGEPAPLAAAERLGRLCESLAAARAGRRARGTYYTPTWAASALARTAVEAVVTGRGVKPDGALSLSVLDPAVGAGAFAVAAVLAIAGIAGQGRCDSDALRAAARDCVAGLDIDPVAAETSRLAVWLVASRPGRPAEVPPGRFAAVDALCDPPAPRSLDVVLGNPPWGVLLDAGRAAALAAACQEGLKGHRDSFLFFLHAAAESVCDTGGIGMLLPDALLSQVRYWGMRRALLARFRPAGVTLLGEGLFGAATAPACMLCLVGRAIAPKVYPMLDLRRIPRRDLPEAAGRPGAPVSRDAAVVAAHNSFAAPAKWVAGLLERLGSRMASLGDLGEEFQFHDVGVNYATAEAGRAILYEGERRDGRDIPIARGRDFGPLTKVGHSAWLRHDWGRRVRPAHRVVVRCEVYALAPKLLLRQTGDRPVATVDTEGVWFGRSVIAITAREEVGLLALAALLNSRACAALYAALAPEVGRAFAQVKVGKLKLLPVPDAQALRPLADLAAAMLDESDPARRCQLMDQIDMVVCRAYGLRPAEVELVQKTAPPARVNDRPGARRARPAATS